MTDVFRTPDERFADLPGFAYEPHYVDVEGLRLHHLDEGSGPTVLCFHGEPSWSYLYRHMLDALVAAGNRVVCPDMAGFGRSDKPTDEDWYTYDRHVDTIAAHIDQLGLEDVTVVVQDWGGPIGLRWAVEHADQVERLVILNTGLFAGRVSKGFMAWRDFVERTPDLPIGMIIQGGTATDLPPEVVAAYDAPYPTPESKAGARAFPLMLPLSPEDPGAAQGQAVADAIRADMRPALLMWGDADIALPLDPVGRKVQSLFPTAEALTVIHDGGHFLQEDQGHEIGALIADWLAHT
jgi:haloalkane dehalogenase